LRVPLSFTSSLTGVLTGISIAHGLPIDRTFLSYVIIVWTLVPLGCGSVLRDEIHAVIGVGISHKERFIVRRPFLMIAASRAPGKLGIGLIL